MISQECIERVMPAWDDIVPEEDRHIVQQTLDAAFRVHMKLGPGFLESIYHQCLAHALRNDGLKVETEVWLPVEFEGMVLDRAHRADLRVNDRVLVEIKAVDALHPIHQAQVVSYLKASGHNAALLLNFNVKMLKTGYERLAHPDLLSERGRSAKLRESEHLKRSNN